MNLLLLSIPTEHNALVAWLERHVAGLNLGQLVAELSVIHGNSHEISLEAICREQLSEVFESGLSVLTVEQISQLLTNPMSLLELQEQAFVAGSLYWGQINAETAAGRMATTLSQTVLSRIYGLESKTITSTSNTTTPDQSVVDKFSIDPDEMLSTTRDAEPIMRSDPRKVARTRGLRIALLLVCASLLLILVRGNPFTHRDAQWGFDGAGALAGQVSAPQLFMQLSDSANDWFKKSPKNAAELKQRLAEFSHGCQTLIEAPLPQLDNASRDWLRTKCRGWKREIDGHIADLEKSPDRFLEVQEGADKLINKLTETLRAGPPVSV